MTTHSSIGMLGGGGKFSVDFSKFYRYLYRLTKMWAKSKKNKKRAQVWKSTYLFVFILCCFKVSWLSGLRQLFFRFKGSNERFNASLSLTMICFSKINEPSVIKNIVIWILNFSDHNKSWLIGTINVTCRREQLTFKQILSTNDLTLLIHIIYFTFVRQKCRIDFNIQPDNFTTKQSQVGKLATLTSLGLGKYHV